MAGAPVETLTRVPLFEELDAAELESVAALMNEANVPAGAVVTAEGGVADGFFIIESGEVEVTAQGESFATLTAGDSRRW
jgi:CRP-like cAMP-binding protein